MTAPHLSRRALFGILTGAAAYAVAPEPLRKYFVIGRPERRWLRFDDPVVLRIVHTGLAEAIATLRTSPRGLLMMPSGDLARLVAQGRVRLAP